MRVVKQGDLVWVGVYVKEMKKDRGRDYTGCGRKTQSRRGTRCKWESEKSNESACAV